MMIEPSYSFFHSQIVKGILSNPSEKWITVSNRDFFKNINNLNSSMKYQKGLPF